MRRRVERVPPLHERGLILYVVSERDVIPEKEFSIDMYYPGEMYYPRER